MCLRFCRIAFERFGVGVVVIVVVVVGKDVFWFDCIEVIDWWFICCVFCIVCEIIFGCF